MRRRGVSAVALVCALALVVTACGSGGTGAGGSRPSGAASAGATIKEFLGAVRSGDWRGACTRLAQYGANSLNAALTAREHTAISISEFDDLGNLKNCPATLHRRGAAIQTLLERSDPSGAASVRKVRGGLEGTVPSADGTWTLSEESTSRPWMIEKVAPDVP